MAENDQLEKLLQELGRAMAEAMASSTDVTAAVHRIRQEGFSLYLVLDGTESDHSLQLEISTVETPVTGTALPVPLPPALQSMETPVAEHTRDPEFRIDGRDVAWLQSLGIDATRSGKKRRSR